MNKISFAIVGGGPAGFYTAKLLSKLPCQPIIHVYEKQLCPFGLIRYGVAPDHLAIKKVEYTLSSIANYSGFRLIGNKQITCLKSIESQYSGLIYAFGASGVNKPKWIPQKLPSTIKMAKQIVYWYNNYPTMQQHKIDLSKIRNVTIIGNGNVSIDIARILLRNPLQLQDSEISVNALQCLYNSKVMNISIIGRRGVTHSAYSLKQVRQLHKHKIQLYAIEEELIKSMTEASYFQSTAIGVKIYKEARMNIRKNEFIKTHYNIIKLSDLPKVIENNKKKVIFRYLLNPIGLKNQNTIQMNQTKLKGQPFYQTAEDIQSSTFQHQFDMLINSTGFEVQPLVHSQHYNLKTKKTDHSNGCLILNDKVDIGKYTVGWCKNGPTGIIDETLLGCEETFNNIRIHYQNNMLKLKTAPIVDQEKTFNFQQYLKVRELELIRGNKEMFLRKRMSSREIRQLYGI